MHKILMLLNSITRKLSEFPQKQAKIWKKEIVAFEKEIAKKNLNIDKLLSM